MKIVVFLLFLGIQGKAQNYDDQKYLLIPDREGKHDLTEYDWAYFVKFANYHFFELIKFRA